MRLIMYDIGLALQHCHRDLKMLDVPRVGDRIKLIDMDAAATSGQSFLGAKFSSGVLPPEMFAELSDAQVTKFGAYWQSRTENDDELWHKVEPRSVLSAGPGIWCLPSSPTTACRMAAPTAQTLCLIHRC